jgi:hypothetical protein
MIQFTKQELDFSSDNYTLFKGRKVWQYNENDRKTALQSYQNMLKKIATIPERESFYCLPAKKRDVPKFSGQYDEVADACIYICPKCSKLMEPTRIEHG